ncbi:hypothetical protein FNV43_RR10765 [Rhamnella rubrinervis]|uniref:Uncharacterized protein n=1 Tax=Rhamnella rubrinervis TaxID=2594499 RepID=A0A8K0H4U5_9ROSA|nr:hypothetical protein FNV43_RR10765 [Rhamnella rubrinervis]
MAAKEEEVVAEVEAVQAVYGDNCLVLDSYPPHLHLHIKPRTADVTSQQFVEAVIGLKASSQYPKERPQIDLIDSKGLDEQRQKLLLSLIQDKASELSSCLMLVALFEEAVEQLSLMNHPDGDCPLCLYPLVEEDERNKTLPFMKLMSCLHCFHSECIIRWWNWLRTEQITNPSDSTETTHPIRDMGNKKDTFGDVESMGNCPVCRKVFQTKDFEHVLDLVGSHSSQLSCDVNEVNGGEKLLRSESENLRRQNFEAILKLQQEHNGVIEPKRDISVSPGMFPLQPVTMHSTVTNKSNEQERKDSSSTSEMNTGDTSKRPDTSMHRNTGMRKQRFRSFKKPVKQWIRKENARAE